MKSTTLLALVPLLWASLVSPASAQQQSSSSGQAWRQTQMTDGTPSTRFSLTGKFLKGPSGNVSNPPVLAIDCGSGRRAHEGRLIAGNLLVGVPLKINYVEPTEIHGTSYYPKVFVQIRVDDAKPEKRSWNPGKDKTSALFAKYSLKKILHAHTVEITTKSDSGSELVMQFDIPDSKQVAEGCDVDTKK